ncbi:MAG TPA: MlaD family protein [Acidiferrobacter sp.]|nr:MlaD family protein [Acidiferrobacter sp.]
MAKSTIPTAKLQHTRWPGLIWAVPIAALAIVGWLALRSYMAEGPSVTVRFNTTGGIKPDNTVVRYRGVTVGHVNAVRLSKSLDEISVTMRFEPYMAGHLGKGTRYWVAGKTVSFADLDSLKSLISGPYIGIDPHPGRTITHVVGLNQEPVLKTEPKGVTVVLKAKELGNISRGAPLYYKDYAIGEIRGETMLRNGMGFDIYAFIPEQYLKLINSRSRFWSSGSIGFSLFGAHSGVHVPGIPALLSGAVTLSTPESGAPVHNDEVFPLYDNAAAARSAPDKYDVSYRLVMAGGPQGLVANAPVLLEGARVGSVTHVYMRYDPHRHSLHTDILIALDPKRIPLSPGSAWNLIRPQAQMNSILRHLIAHGLRAQLSNEVALIGPKLIALNQFGAARPAQLIAGHPPQIPMVASAGIDETVKQINAVMRQIHGMRLPEIARNIHTLTARLAQLSRSPQTQQTLKRLDQSMTQLDQLLQTANVQLPEILAALHGTVQQANKALGAANALLHNGGTAASGPESASLPHTLYELSQTAQSLRALLDYLDSHPNALVFGKKP